MLNKSDHIQAQKKAHWTANVGQEGIRRVGRLLGHHHGGHFVDFPNDGRILNAVSAALSWIEHHVFNRLPVKVESVATWRTFWPEVYLSHGKIFVQWMLKIPLHVPVPSIYMLFNAIRMPEKVATSARMWNIGSIDLGYIAWITGALSRSNVNSSEYIPCESSSRTFWQEVLTNSLSMQYSSWYWRSELLHFVNGWPKNVLCTLCTVTAWVRWLFNVTVWPCRNTAPSLGAYDIL